MRGTILFAGMLLAGCSSSTSLSEISTGLSVAASLGWASQLGLTAFSTPTNAASCVEITQACGETYPCQGMATLTLDDACALPFGVLASGQAQITATLSSATSAVVSTTFVDARVGKEALAVVRAENITISNDTGGTTVTYSGENVATGGGVLAAQSSWQVTIQDQGTSDPNDDVYLVDGSNQNVGNGAVDQYSVSGARLDPSCRLNPIDGSATLEHVATLSIVDETVSFHAACDGRADIVSATGSHSSPL